MKEAPSGDQIWNLCKWRHLVTKFGTNASAAIWWPKKLQPLKHLVKLRKSSQVMILPDIRKCSNSDQNLVTNRYSCFWSLGAIWKPLWLKNSHNMAIFPYFLTSLVTFLVVRTTFMHLSSAERTQTLLTHVGWRYGAIFAFSGHIYGAGGVQSRAILESKSDYYGRLVTGWGPLLETSLWAISHLITWHNMT